MEYSANNALQAHMCCSILGNHWIIFFVHLSSHRCQNGSKQANLIYTLTKCFGSWNVSLIHSIWNFVFRGHFLKSDVKYAFLFSHEVVFLRNKWKTRLRRTERQGLDCRDFSDFRTHMVQFIDLPGEELYLLGFSFKHILMCFQYVTFCYFITSMHLQQVIIFKM